MTAFKKAKLFNPFKWVRDIIREQVGVKIGAMTWPQPVPKPTDEPKYRIIHNRVVCKKCHDIIESLHRHDFVTCSCESISVDGGTDYLRRVGDLDNYIEISATEEIVEED